MGVCGLVGGPWYPVVAETTLFPFRVWRWGVLHLATGLVGHREREGGGRDGSLVGGVVGWVVDFGGRRCAVDLVGVGLGYNRTLDPPPPKIFSGVIFLVDLCAIAQPWLAPSLFSFRLLKPLEICATARRNP